MKRFFGQSENVTHTHKHTLILTQTLKPSFRQVLTPTELFQEVSAGQKVLTFQKYPHSQGLKLTLALTKIEVKEHTQTHTVRASAAPYPLCNCKHTLSLSLTPTRRDQTIWHRLNWTCAEHRSSYNRCLHRVTWEIHEHYTYSVVNEFNRGAERASTYMNTHTSPRASTDQVRINAFINSKMLLCPTLIYVHKQAMRTDRTARYDPSS